MSDKPPKHRPIGYTPPAIEALLAILCAALLKRKAVRYDGASSAKDSAFLAGNAS